MASKRKFFRQVVEIEILSEDVPLEWDDLVDINHAISEGACSGRVRELHRIQVKGGIMARLLQGQESDPAFFNLTEDGEDADGSSEEE